MHSIVLGLCLKILAIQLMGTGAANLQSCQTEFDAILTKATVLNCKIDPNAASDANDCSIKGHMSRLAETKNVELQSLINRASVALVLSAKLAADIEASWNTSLEVQTARHSAFVAKVDCSSADAADVCSRVRKICADSSNNEVFLLSAYCSDSVACAPIGSYIDLDDRPSMPPSVLSYVVYRLLERQLFIAKELGEVVMGVSSKSEYLIQKEIQEAHGNRLLSGDGTPVAMFVTWPVKSPAYYHILALFLDAALGLKKLFSFHIVDVKISRISEQSARPSYRYELENHQAYLALYTKEHCDSKPDWAFNCKPIVATADVLVTSQQFSSFLLHQLLKVRSARLDVLNDLQFPVFSQPEKLIEVFAAVSDSYVLEVVTDKNELNNILHDWERLRDISVNLGGLFGITFYPLITTKSIAIEVLKNLKIRIELASACETQCFIIRMPGADHELLDRFDPTTKLNSVVQDAIDRNEWYHASVRMSIDNLDNFNLVELPSALINCGHLLGGDCSAGSVSTSSAKPSIKASFRHPDTAGRTDAFVEQSKFKEVYETTGILVVEQSQELLDSFLLGVGSDKPWLVLFTVPWSPLSKAARAIWSAVDQCIKRTGMHDIQLVKLDCFEANKLCSYLEVNAYPTVAMFSRGSRLSTYTGPISLGKMCAFANLALSPLMILHSDSSEKTHDLVKKFLPLMSRVFVISGPDISSSIAAIATELQFKEVFVFEQLENPSKELITFSAFYDESYPSSWQFLGDINDADSLKKFIIGGHLDVIFPCNWAYLVEAVNSTRPLFILFHSTQLADHLEMLKTLGEQVIKTGASICHLLLHRHLELDDLVQRTAGHSLPSLVLLTGDRRSLHRLPLGPIAANSLIQKVSQWALKGLSGQLDDGQPIASPEAWKPAHQVYNFVEQLYEANKSKVSNASKAGNSRVSSRVLSAVTAEATGEDYSHSGQDKKSTNGVDDVLLKSPIHQEL